MSGMELSTTEPVNTLPFFLFHHYARKSRKSVGFKNLDFANTHLDHM